MPIFKPTCLMVRTIRMRSFKYDTEKQHVGARRLHFVDERARIGKAGRIRLEQHDLDAFAWRFFAQAVRRRGAECGILENHRDFRLFVDGRAICSCACANCEARANGVNV